VTSLQGVYVYIKDAASACPLPACGAPPPEGAAAPLLTAGCLGVLAGRQPRRMVSSKQLAYLDRPVGNAQGGQRTDAQAV
jgi:hypothetical protein